MDIEDCEEEEELLDWDEAEEAEDTEAAPMAMDGGDLLHGQAREAPVPRSDADMDAAATSPSSGGSIGEGQIDAAAAPPVEPRQPKLRG